MADSTIQVLEGLFATPIMAEDEYGNPIGAVETGVSSGGLKPTYSTLTPREAAPPLAGFALLGLFIWLFVRQQR